MPAVLRLCFVLICLAVLAGCGITPYASYTPDNVTVQPNVESGDSFVARGARVGIYRVDRKCPMEFLGWVDVDGKPVHFGLPAGQKVYLRVVFTQSARNGSTRRSYGAAVTPRRGARYRVKVNWVDGLSSAKVQQVSTSGKVLHDFALGDFPCREE